MYWYNATKLETNYLIILKYFCHFIFIIISYSKLLSLEKSEKYDITSTDLNILANIQNMNILVVNLMLGNNCH